MNESLNSWTDVYLAILLPIVVGGLAAFIGLVYAALKGKHISNPFGVSPGVVLMITQLEHLQKMNVKKEDAE